MSDTPKRRWYQFSLRWMLIVVTLAAMGSAWWQHRSFCLKQSRIHAERNAACARRVFGIGKEDDLTTVEGLVSWGGSGSENWHFGLWVSPTDSGYRRWSLTLGGTGKPPIREEKIQADMDHEAEMADRYLHALWRPWERMWITETQAPTDSGP